MPHTPELINKIWQGFWGVVGIDENQVPRCGLANGEIKGLEKENRMVLLLPPEIFKPDGLVKLASAFSLTRDSWINDINEARKIKHISMSGGCIDVEATISPPVEYVLKNELELREKIEKQSGIPMRIPTYVATSMFKMLFDGYPFDHIGTTSGLLGSSIKGKGGNRALSATFNISKNHIVVFHEVDSRYSNLGWRSERLHEKGRHFWQNHHLRNFSGHKVA